MEARQVRLQYKAKIVAVNMNFGLRKAEIVSIIGPNGSGKSTLLKALGRLVPPTAGSIFVDGVEAYSLKPEAFARKVAIVVQSAEFPGDLTVLDLVSYGRMPHAKTADSNLKRDRQAVESALQSVGISEYRHRRMDSLSGGERQRVRIALALAQEPEILLLDEPTTYLDIHHQLELLHLVHVWRAERNLAVVMVLHDLNHAACFSDRIVAVKDGGIFADGAVDEVFTDEVLRELYGIEPCVLRMRRGDREYPVCFPQMSEQGADARHGCIISA